MLRKAGHLTCHARDGLSALATIRTFEPDAVLLDIGLPLIGGARLCTIVRQDVRFRLMPIIMMASSRNEADMMTSFEAGADDLVAEPISETTLEALLEHHLNTRRPVDSIDEWSAVPVEMMGV